MKPKLIHCSYHKCLTVYFSKVFSTLYNRIFRFSRGYRHFNSLVGDFYQDFDSYKVSSVNNHALDLKRLGGDFRITRFIRDPRDLVVSGYFYHKRGAEDWSNIADPKEKDWEVVNGFIPEGMGKGQSFSSYLQSINKEKGLMAEIDFRSNHFDSMLQWPTEDPRIKVFRYEDLLGNECDVFEDIFSFYGMSWPEKKLGLLLADRFSAKKMSGSTKHIRNPKSGQWEEHFTPKVEDYFNKKYADILKRYGYERG
jgi:hypothetical protein